MALVFSHRPINTYAIRRAYAETVPCSGHSGAVAVEIAVISSLGE